MEHSLVSIIIPIYNVSDYLDACIQSACNQTYSYLEIFWLMMVRQMIVLKSVIIGQT